MRSAAILSMVALLFSPVADAGTDMRAEFERLSTAWMNAYNSGDAEELGSLYADDAEYLSSHVPGLVAHGRDRIVENFGKGIRMGGHIDSVAILSINVSCDLGSMVCRYHATNAGTTVTGRNLLVVKKMHGTWLIVTHMTVV